MGVARQQRKSAVTMLQLLRLLTLFCIFVVTRCLLQIEPQSSEVFVNYSDSKKSVALLSHLTVVDDESKLLQFGKATVKYLLNNYTQVCTLIKN